MKVWRVCGVFLAVFLLGTLVLQMSFYPQARAQPNTGAPIFSDSFQSGTELTNETPPGAWDGNYLPDGAPDGSNTVQSSIVYGDSNYAADFTATNATQYGCVYKNLASSYAVLESSTMIYLSRMPIDAVLGTTLCYNYDSGTFFTLIETSGGNTYWGIEVYLDSGVFQDYLESTPSNPSANIWYNVTLYGQVGDNATAYLWVNGILKVSVSGISVTTRAPLSCVRDEFWLNVGESSQISCYSDNITVYASDSLEPSGTFGYTTVGSSTISDDESTADLICGYAAAPSYTGLVNSISAYVYAQSGTVDLEGALYTYAGPGTPGTLIANTSEITVGTTPQWNNMTFSSPPSVTAGIQYWIVWWQDGGTSYAYDAGGPSGCGFYIFSNYTFPDWPTSISGQTSSSAQRSLYATYSYFTVNLTVSVSGHGVTNATGTSTQVQYSNVSVLATPDSGYVLSYWLLDGTDVGSANPYTVNMTDNLDLTAVFSSAVYLSLSVDPSTATYLPGESVYLNVAVINEAGSPVNSTLTLTITGPGGYGYFDFDRINAPVGFSYCSFNWAFPYVAGTYVVEVSLVPIQLTAYDAAWLEVT